MDELNKEFSSVLEKENDLLDKITGKQIELRGSLTKKDWDTFLPLMNELNKLTDEFEKVDSRRDVLQKNFRENELTPFKELLVCLRDKLLKCKVETKVIQDYVTTTKEFISSVVNEAIPRDRNKNYTKKGTITDSSASSILLDLQG